MFYYIKGELVGTDTTGAVIDVGGVGYRMTVSQTTLNSLPRIGSEAKLFTHLAVRDDGIELFGFGTLDELAAFKMLIGVSGVGAKVAVSVLSFLTPEKLALAVCSDDKKTIGKASGVGPKTAARIVLELKDKLSGGRFAQLDGLQDTPLPASGGEMSDALEALSALGFSRSDVLSSLRGVDTAAMSAEDIIKASMKKLVKS